MCDRTAGIRRHRLCVLLPCTRFRFHRRPTALAIWSGFVYVDGDNAIDALTDGLLILRAMFGLTGAAVTRGAVGSGATRTDWATIRTYLNSCGGSFAP